MVGLKLFAVLLLAITQVVIAQEHAKLLVKQHPSYQVYNYKTSGTLKLTDFKDLVLAANGFTISRDIEWTGLKSTSSMASPKMTLLFLTDANMIADESEKSLVIDQDTSVDFAYLKNFATVQTYETTPSTEELKECSNALFYVIKVSESDDLQSSIDRIMKSISVSCGVNAKEDLLVYVLATDKTLRTKRAAAEKRALGSVIVNRAIFYADNYPVMFHLIFWTSLVIGLAVIGISCAMFKMDPGLDTVIYRMTNQRIKKDN